MISTSTQTNRNVPKLFELGSEDDDKELKLWCRLHWQYTLTKGIQGCNAPTYHDCCVSFSRRGCVKKISHPTLQSASVLKIPSLRNTTSPEALHRWLRERLTVHHNLGKKKLYFPSINIAHFDSEEDEEEDIGESAELLAKRCVAVSEENHQLREQNKQLLFSSKSWHDKYQALLFKTEQDCNDSYTETTPLKAVKQEISNRDILSI